MKSLTVPGGNYAGLRRSMSGTNLLVELIEPSEVQKCFLVTQSFAEGSEALHPPKSMRSSVTPTWRHPVEMGAPQSGSQEESYSDLDLLRLRECRPTGCKVSSSCRAATALVSRYSVINGPRRTVAATQGAGDERFRLHHIFVDQPRRRSVPPAVRERLSCSRQTRPQALREVPQAPP